MVVRYLDQKIREKHFSFPERELEKTASSAAAAKGKTKGRGKIIVGDCIQWTAKGQCSRGEVWNAT